MITFNAVDTELPTLDETRVIRWVKTVADSFRRKVGDINYIFVSDAEILRLNRQFIGHDYYTDHIGFDYCEGSILSGDICISVDTVRTNAEKYSTSYDDELHRVIIHGLLHLCGINDKTPGERQQMEAEEDKALEIYGRL